MRAMNAQASAAPTQEAIPQPPQAPLQQSNSQTQVNTQQQGQDPLAEFPLAIRKLLEAMDPKTREVILAQPPEKQIEILQQVVKEVQPQGQEQPQGQLQQQGQTNIPPEILKALEQFPEPIQRLLLQMEPDKLMVLLDNPDKLMEILQQLMGGGQ